MKIYTGIGSRLTPPNILILMKKIALILSKNDYLLRSGGAAGADSAFEDGCDMVQGEKEIYLPWKNFNKNNSKLFNVSKEAIELASTIHKCWNYLSFGAKKLIARNMQQILGQKLDSPTDFVVCWTPDGKTTGGTGTALKLAENKNIPIYNLYFDYDLTLLEKKINIDIRNAK